MWIQIVGTNHVHEALLNLVLSMEQVVEVEANRHNYQEKVM